MVVSSFLDEVEYSAAREVLAKSKLTAKQAGALAAEAKKGIAKKHALR
jgi:hypothetical protein